MLRYNATRSLRQLSRPSTVNANRRAASSVSEAASKVSEAASKVRGGGERRWRMIQCRQARASLLRRTLTHTAPPHDDNITPNHPLQHQHHQVKDTAAAAASHSHSKPSSDVPWAVSSVSVVCCT